MINVFIGYDSNEEVAYHVLVSSIIRRTSEPVSITPINLNSLKLIFNRKRSILQSTEFSFSRFLVPYLSDYQGWSIFMDCDMLMLDDIAKLWELRNDKYALMCVHHNHVPDKNLKFLNQTQTKYERKNWSSVMLMNNAKCTALTLQYVETASGLDLHRFRWLKDELIGEIPHRWNHLVDYDPNLPITEISNLHYTEGGPYFEDYKNCGYSNEWLHEFSQLSKPFNNWSK
jgi:lipopolysaccharide biosynthesis glycosyltransferase